MGKMSFPENLTKPARTVMATMSGASRESMIFGYKADVYRFPTIREAASIMSFPIDYIFHGKSIATKYKMVGNAVPPMLSKAFAERIFEKETGTINNKYKKIIKTIPENFINFNGHNIELKVEKQKRPDAKFKYHIPDFIKKSYRVELTNYDLSKAESIQWNVKIHRSQGKTAKIIEPIKAMNLVNETIRLNINREINNIQHKLVNLDDLQEIYIKTDLERKKINKMGPIEILEFAKEVTEKLENARSIYVHGAEINEIAEIPEEIILGYVVLNRILERMGE